MSKNRFPRGGMGGMGGMNMNQIMKQAQKMQEQLAEAQEKTKDLEVNASAGGGMVRVTASGDMRIKSIELDKDAVDPEDVELLQDMILAAVNDALTSAQKAADNEINASTGLGDALGGMGMGGLGGMGGLF